MSGLSNSVRLALFAAALAALASVAALAGRASGLDVSTDGPGAMAHAETGDVAAVGLSDTARGLRLEVPPVALRPGVTKRLRLSILAADGEPVTALDTHDDEPALHLIFVRRDLGDYRHLHPVREGDGYAVDVTMPSAGAWRAYADFELGGEKIVLGRDLLVAGDFVPEAPPVPGQTVRSDGYRVELDARELRAGQEARLEFGVERNGRIVERLQPYLGADGHLVAIREGDLAYRHVHPVESVTGTVAFDAELGEPGRYVFFLQFKHRDRVTTAPFTVDVGR